jgi:Protein of unknown function (DUF664)
METRDVLGDAFGRIVMDLEGAVEGLDGDALAFRPDPEANSIGWLVWHATRVQDDHVSELAGRSQAYVELGFHERFGLDLDATDIGYGHSSDQVATVRFDDPALLVEYLRAVTGRTCEYLAGVDAAELDRVVDRRWDPPVTAGVRLVSVVDDSLQHAGQAAYVRGLLERRSTPSAS